MNHRTSVVALLGALMIGLPNAVAEDWPQWRNVDGSGVSKESDWISQGRADAVWTREVGIGYTSFVIQDDRVLTAGHDVEGEEDTIYCLDASTGKELWTFTYPCKRWDKYHIGGTQSTPTIDGDVVYALNREGMVYALKLADGSVIWKKDLMNEVELEYPTWMFSASPLLQGDSIVLNVGRLVSLDKKTGRVNWKSVDTGHAYSTPQPMTIGGRALLAAINSTGLAVFNATNGEQLAHHEWVTKYDINASTPIVMGNRIFISSGQNRGCAMLEFANNELKVVWENKSMSTKMTGCILWDDHLYGFDDAILKCIGLDGQEKWSQRGLGMGTLMVADGRLIVLSSKGELIIAEATPNAFTELSRAKVLDGGVYWTMPVLANGLIYCRSSEGKIAVIDHRPSAS